MSDQPTESLQQKLVKIQRELKAPKTQYNKHGKYKYRSCEDILEAAKPILHKYGCTLVVSDDIVNVGTDNYVKAIATLASIDDHISVCSFAKEDVSSNNFMSAPQRTGSASSYARKYALNGLFCIDDTKDSDFTNDHGKGPDEVKDPYDAEVAKVLDMISNEDDLKALADLWLKKLPLEIKQIKEVEQAKDKRKKYLEKKMKEQSGGLNE